MSDCYASSMRLEALVLMAIPLACAQHADFADGSVEDAPSDPAPIICGSFSEALSCPWDASVDDAGTCPSPQGIITQDGGFPIGCWVIEDDRSEAIDGSCMTPIYTCVGTPYPHWEVSWVPE